MTNYKILNRNLIEDDFNEKYSQSNQVGHCKTTFAYNSTHLTYLFTDSKV